MEKVKASIKEFTSHSGHDDTTVHEKVAPAVQQETVKPHQHEQINTAVDKEVHQDHYHRTVQPVQDREVLPETHTANIGAVQHREFDHRDHEHTERALADDQRGFKDHRLVADTSHSQSVNPAVGGEHVHHHVHETIQPVVHKETIQPHVVHTTVPVHETHHNAPKHHQTSELPPVTMDEYKHKGGALGGREERHDEFEGGPGHIGGRLAGGTAAAHKKRDSHHADEQFQARAEHVENTSDAMQRHGRHENGPTHHHADRKDPMQRHGDVSGPGSGGAGLSSNNRTDSVGGLGAGAGSGVTGAS